MIIGEHRLDSYMFNRSAALNAAATIALKQFADILVLHDIDLVPSPSFFRQAYLPLYHSRHESTLQDKIVHLASAWTKYRYPTFLGGALALPLHLYWSIGGMPIDFFGWGGEDDALYNRLQKLDRWSWSLVTFPKDDAAFTDLERSLEETTYRWKRSTPKEQWMNPYKRESIAKDRDKPLVWKGDIKATEARMRSIKVKCMTSTSMHISTEWISFELE